MNTMRMLACAFIATAPLFAADVPCDPGKANAHFRVAHARHFNEPEGKTLSLRVSVPPTEAKLPDILDRVGCALARKYSRERRWHALVFSNYEVAKNYQTPSAEQKEPAEYIGSCMAVNKADKPRVQCGKW